MIREKIKGIDGKVVEILRPENRRDEERLAEMARAGELAVGESFADIQEATESELIGGDILEADTPER